jgi:hypothetical protein
MDLTYTQREFLLHKFFKNESYPGWRDIATKLLDNGYCVVAGDSCIWRGGIGNFITTKESDLFIKCLEYFFDLNEFLGSEWFKKVYQLQLDTLALERKQAENKVLTITNTVKELDELSLRGIKDVN